MWHEITASEKSRSYLGKWEVKVFENQAQNIRKKKDLEKIYMKVSKGSLSSIATKWIQLNLTARGTKLQCQLSVELNHVSSLTYKHGMENTGT